MSSLYWTRCRGNEPKQNTSQKIWSRGEERQATGTQCLHAVMGKSWGGCEVELPAVPVSKHRVTNIPTLRGMTQPFSYIHGECGQEFWQGNKGDVPWYLELKLRNLKVWGWLGGWQESSGGILTHIWWLILLLAHHIQKAHPFAQKSWSYHGIQWRWVGNCIDSSWLDVISLTWSTENQLLWLTQL